MYMFNQKPASVKTYVLAYSDDNGFSSKHYAKVENNVVTARIGGLEVMMHRSTNAYFSLYGIPTACFVK